VSDLATDPPKPSNAEPEERLLSPATADAVAGMFAQLAAVRRQQRRITEFPMGGAERSLEDLVRELLNSLMRDWLEEKAAPIVERAVQTQLARALGQVDGV
jgi:cell pole-organizing protein PopZ